MGRPRKRQAQPSDVEPREQILSVAAQLFGARGIDAVSMGTIAAQCGLGQSSLYYWFRGKEPILAELLSRVNRLPLAHARELEARALEPAQQLYQLVHFDVLNVCRFPLEITEVHRFIRRRPPVFASYWEERAELASAIEQLVSRGIAAGAFRDVDAHLTAFTIIAQDESVQNWWTNAGAGADWHVDPRACCFRAEQVAEHVASATVAGVLARPFERSAFSR